MKPGDIAEVAIWLTGTETPDLFERFKNDCEQALIKDAANHKVAVGPITWSILRPGDERVPAVPDHIHGPDVRLLVGEAKVGYRPDYSIMPASGFTADLDKNDLARLRKLTRRAHARRHPGDRLSDRHCDQIIEALGPTVAVRTLRDGEAVH